MKKLVVIGNNKLKGNIKISGAKNSAVALIPASLLADGEVVIENVPNISDINSLGEILKYLGVHLNRENNKVTINLDGLQNKKVPEEIGTKLRASYYFMASLLAKFKKVEMYFPGGCSIGARPIDQTLKVFKALGATVIEKDNLFEITADRLIGNDITLDMPSVGATINAIIAASKAEGITTIKNAAREPEIVDVADFLNNMGANIKDAGTSTITIVGVNKLHGCTHKVIPDRIEAGTYIIAGALLGNNLKIENVNCNHIKSLLDILIKMGTNIQIFDDYVIVSKSSTKCVDIITEGYPGFPTDLQQPITPLLINSDGISTIKETIYENRFQNVKYLVDMGANINLINNKEVEIIGKGNLFGKEVFATDLRAGACMLLAALNAEGTTVINEVEHILRGYENITEKLTNIGANIRLEEI